MKQLIIFTFLSGILLKYTSNAILKYKDNIDDMVCGMNRLDDMIRELNLKVTDIESDVDNLEKKIITTEEISKKIRK